MKCIFCELKDREDIVYENDLVYSIYDSFPVTKGHLLIITKRHIQSYFDLSKDELLAIDDALKKGKEILEKLYKPSGYNIGVNDGSSAGQTIMHLHVHLIPRYEFDTENPKGGVRGVIPEKQKY